MINKQNNLGECRREYIGIESSTLSRSNQIGAEFSAILSPNFTIHLNDFGFVSG
jgi:hypothetical protein